MNKSDVFLYAFVALILIAIAFGLRGIEKIEITPKTYNNASLYMSQADPFSGLLYGAHGDMWIYENKIVFHGEGFSGNQVYLTKQWQVLEMTGNTFNCVYGNYKTKGDVLEFSFFHSFRKQLNDEIEQSVWIVPWEDVNCYQKKFVGWRPTTYLFSTSVY